MRADKRGLIEALVHTVNNNLHTAYTTNALSTSQIQLSDPFKNNREVAIQMQPIFLLFIFLRMHS